MKKIITIVVLIVFYFFPQVYADNILTVHDPLAYVAKQAYIDTCILEIEPHGSYVEQSLILTYSDHGQYAPDRQLEVVHHFELPSGAVINDLWLWMPDTIMKAIVLDTWTAQSIYDSIVSRARDPAFLSKTGSQFKLQVYPLMGGSYRKIRLNCISPTRWLGNQATATIPLRMIKADPSETPMTILFRAKEDFWGEPYLIELPDYQFTDIGDSAGYHFKKIHIHHISELDQLNLAYQQSFIEGYYFQSNPFIEDTSYFQLGLSLAEIFNLIPDTSAHHFQLGIDLSGYYNNNPDELIFRLRNLLPVVLRPKDTFQLAVAAGGIYQSITDEPLLGDSMNIFQVLDKLQQSEVIDSAICNRKKSILYCDRLAAKCWKFQGITALANIQIKDDIRQCLNDFLNFEVVTAYEHGHEKVLSQAEADSVIASLNQFFKMGGHFLSFFDYNRERGKEKIATTFIPGLKTKNSHIRGYLHGVPTGRIGRYFPASVWANTVNELTYNPNPDVIIEVIDEAGEPVVISKPIDNGILVVSGIWSFGDDDAMRATFGKPLLGLTNLSSYYQLPELLDSLAMNHKKFPFDRAILVSNSDTLISPDFAPQLISNYLQQFNRPIPRFHSINLLDGKEIAPLYVQIKDSYYYGNGYYMKLLADSTKGLHFELFNQDWDQIEVALNPQSPPPRENLSINYQIDNGAGTLIEQMEVAPEPFNIFKPSFFIGKIQGMNSVDVNIKANFLGTDSLFEKDLTFPIETDTLKKTHILPAMLANEKILNLFSSYPLDTAKIVNLAVKYNLLTDFTAMLCLEPEDTTRKNPEEELTDVEALEDENDSSTEIFAANIYPNPFNLSTSINFTLAEAARMRIAIYNIMGQLVRLVDWTDYEKGHYSFIWDGKDDLGNDLCSGIYLIRIYIKSRGKVTNEIVWNGKIALLK